MTLPARSPRRSARAASISGLVRRLLVLIDDADPNAGRVRARQIQTIIRFTPATVLANLLNGLLLLSVFQDTLPPWTAITWFGLLALMMAFAHVHWMGTTRRPPRETASHRAMTRSAQQSAMVAIAWAVVPLVLFPMAGAHQQTVLAAVTAGMLCAGGFILSTVPMAGYAYVSILGLASTIGLTSSDTPYRWLLTGLLFSYTLIVLMGIYFLARNFAMRTLAELKSEQQNQVIGLLLRDFEENASDVLWETDAQGRLSRPSPRLLAALGVERECVGTQAFVEWLAQGHELDAEIQTATPSRLRQLFAGREPFRDITVRLGSAERASWWSLTAKPLSHSDGQSGGWRGVLSDVTEARVSHRKLLRQAHNDSLTGLANRMHFLAQLGTTLANAQLRRSCAVLCLDLDGFKSVNDSLGHSFGDGLLREVALRLRDAVRDEDLVARLGGDEFAVLLRRAESEAEACAVAERIIESISRPVRIDSIQVPIGVSVGVALVTHQGELADHADQLMVSADLALYAAKDAGKGVWRVYRPEMGSQNRRRLAIEQALRQAIERDELSLAYQPQVAIDSWRVTGFEALLRWENPLLGRVSPAEFVPIAEDSGLIDRIGAWVLREACREAMRWPEDIHLAVNVSPVQTMSGSLATAVDLALASSGLPAGRLELEITESVFLNEGAGALAVLHELRRLGVRIALDDFGIGYSSLAYLRRFPFDTLKIDRAFVREIASRADTRAIVHTIVGLARTLSIETVAEGVEDENQLKLLLAQGCNTVQGYFASPPIAASAIDALLADWRTTPVRTRPAPIAPRPGPVLVR